MTFILPSFGASAIAAVPGSGGGGGAWNGNTYSLDLDGVNEHAITSASPIDYDDMANGYTFSGWVWREDVPSLPSNGGTTGWFGGAYSTNDGSIVYPYLRWYITDEYWAGSALTALNWVHGSQGVNNTSTLLPAGAWSHLAVTWDGSSTVTTYLNGSQLAQITSASSLASRTDKMAIGRGHWYHKGLVDEVAYWNQGLSAAQITNIYRGEENGGSGGTNGTPGDLSTFNPIGWWRCGDNDGGTGTTITDQGVDSNGDPSGNDATLVNSPTFSTSVPS